MGPIMQKFVATKMNIPEEKHLPQILCRGILEKTLIKRVLYYKRFSEFRSHYYNFNLKTCTYIYLQILETMGSTTHYRKTFLKPLCLARKQCQSISVS